MISRDCRGVTLIELLTVMVIAGLAGTMILPVCLAFQSRGLVEIGRNDLHDRAERLLRFLGNDLREAAFLTGAQPQHVDGSPLTLIHDSRPGDPLELLPTAIMADSGGATDHDALTLVKAVSFSPPISLWFAADAQATELTLNRSPNQSPGSSREIRPAPEAISHLLLANQPVCYPVCTTGQTLHLEHPLRDPAAAGTEVLGARAYRYALEAHGGTGRLQRDDFTHREILDNAVDGLQFEYLLESGEMVDQPEPRQIRGIRISLLVRSLHEHRGALNRDSYRLADRSYGPFNDHYRRIQVSQLIEVKNNGR